MATTLTDSHSRAYTGGRPPDSPQPTLVDERCQQEARLLIYGVDAAGKAVAPGWRNSPPATSQTVSFDHFHPAHGNVTCTIRITPGGERGYALIAEVLVERADGIDPGLTLQAGTAILVASHGTALGSDPVTNYARIGIR